MAGPITVSFGRAMLVLLALGSAAAARIALADEPSSPTRRPLVTAKLTNGQQWQGELERFDDGEYWLQHQGKRITFSERDIATIEFTVPLPGAAPLTAEQQRIAELVRRFFTPPSSERRRESGVDVTLIPHLAAVGEPLIQPLLDEFERRGGNDYQAVGLVLKQMGPSVFPQLVESVRRDPGRSASFPVRYTLRESGVQHANFVAELLKDKDPRIRQLAMDVLYAWSITSGVALPPSLDAALIAVLDDTDESVRSQTPLILWRIGFNSPHVLPALLRTMTDEKYAGVRSNSVIALGHLGQDLKPDDPELARIVSALTSALADDPSENIRSYAANYLGHMGSNARSAKTALVRATDDKKPRVRESATEALRKIESERPRDPFNGR